MRLDHNDFRALPLHMQERVGLALLAQMAQAHPVAGMEEQEGSCDVKCDPRVFARCPYNKTCIAPGQTDFTEGSDCFLFRVYLKTQKAYINCTKTKNAVE